MIEARRARSGTSAGMKLDKRYDGCFRAAVLSTLVRPALDEASLRRAHALKDEELREEFVAKLKR